MRALRGFEAAARLLSFTEAARELNVTQGAISRQIHDIGELLGVTLFRRYRVVQKLDSPAGDADA